MPGDKTRSVITVTLRIRGLGTDDYGIAKITFPCSEIDWSLADGPRDRVGIDDIYQVDLHVEQPDDTSRTDTWDRA